jgi:hypothetical protein
MKRNDIGDTFDSWYESKTGVSGKEYNRGLNKKVFIWIHVYVYKQKSDESWSVERLKICV